MLGIIPLTGLPEINRGDDLSALLVAELAASGQDLQANDIVVVAQKIVSKAEDRFVTLSDIVPSRQAAILAQEVCKDARLVELILRQSVEVVRAAPHVLITRHRLGHVMANAGIDASNVGSAGEDRVLLLPEDPDSSAREIADALKKEFKVRPGVIVSDSFGRPWRTGTVNVAIGIGGMPAVIDRRGDRDRDGRVMQMTTIALADAVAAAAGLAMGEGSEGIPAAVVRGLVWTGAEQSAGALLRPVAEDLFR